MYRTAPFLLATAILSISLFINAPENISSSAGINTVARAKKTAVSTFKTTDETTDTDGDGINNITDIDDDNDGILDAVESPLCYYTIAEANIISKITSQFTSPDDDQSDGDLQMLHDGATTATFNFNAFSTTANPTGSNLFTLEYLFPVKLASIAVSDNISSTADANAVIVGSNDGINWSAALSPSTLVTTTPVVFTITATQGYKYYRVQTGTVPGALALADIIGEINHTLASPYIPSANPKATCTDANIDGDAIPPHLDLDTDNDGCSDGVEAGNTLVANNNTTTFNTGSDANANGLLDQFESTTAPGTINYTSTYLLNAVNASITACTDSDGDSILDINDIDDDNDGVLDNVEGNVNTYLNTSCEANLLARMGYTTAFTLNNEVADKIGLIVGIDNSFTTGFPVGTICGNISLGTSTSSFNAWIYFKFVNPYNSSIQVPLNYLNLTSDCSGSNEIVEYDAYDINGNFLYNQSLTTPSYGANHCVTIQPPAGTDVYSIRVRQSLSSAILSGISLKGVTNYRDIDTDNDGIPNRLDLDSDGDGCPDTKEAILYTNSSVAAAPGNVKNGSGGMVTSTISTPDATVPGPYGSNGFADAIQSSTDADAYKYNYTYNFLATIASNNPCKDSDGDGFSDFAEDIDADNDGIPNAIESPSCFLTETQAMVITNPVTSDFTWDDVNSLSNTYDQNPATYGLLTPSVNIQDKALVTFSLPFVGPAVIESVSVSLGSAALGTGTWQLEGLSATNTWTALSATQVMNTINSTFTLSNTLASGTAFHSYRIKGVSSTTVTNNARLNEFTVKYSNYQASLHPVNTGCSSDTDGDAVPNFQDRDSDGDGCPDAVEANVSGTLIAGPMYNAGTGSVVTANAVVQGPYGTNGLADDVETPAESGILNYTNTYNLYAVYNNIKACTDTDKDGIRDVFDIDDDNDGITDPTEQNCSTGITTKNDVTVSIPSTISYTFAGSRTLANLVDGSTALYVMGVPSGTLNNSEWFRVEFGTPRILTEWEIGHVSGQRLFNASSTYKVQGSADGNHWTDLTGTLTYMNTGAGQGTSSNIATFAQNNNPYIYYRYFGITGASGGGYTNEFYFREKTCTGTDTDGDGVLNQLDLDSDGDGCPDASEAGVSSNTGASGSMSVSGGSIYSGGIAPGTPNAYVGDGTAGQYGGNGFFNNIEAGSESGVYNGSYTYQLVIGSNYAACKDTDGDAVSDVTDMDDDNDGILDGTESPSCFYTAAEMAVPSSVSTEIPTTETIANLYDNNTTTTFAFTSTTAANALGKTIFEITPVFPQASTAIVVNLNTATSPIGALSATATLKAEGWNGSTWVTLQTYTTTQTVSSNTQTFAFSNTTVYSKYRLFESGTNGVAIGTSAIQEVKLAMPASYNPSANPKPACTTDTDGDGILNHQDLDSDGDGCSDASETGITGTLLPGYLINNTGLVYSAAAIAQGPYGSNGFANQLETSTSPESGVYSGSYTNYSNATNSAMHSCSATPLVKPDVNVTYVNIAASGNLKTNDTVPSGSTYGTAATLAGYTNPGPATPTITGSAGAYTFTSSIPGIYKFLVPVCPPSVSTNCPVSLLTIDVLEPVTHTNKPFTAPDFAVTKKNKSIILKTLANDRSGNDFTSLQPSAVTITSSPKHGTAVVNSTTGDITYTPETGFTGVDTLTYNVCDNASPTPNCASDQQIITVLPVTAANSVIASDDFLFVPAGTTGTGNVLNNDLDTDAHTITATPQDITIPGTGRFILASDGSYTFTPEGSYTGPVNFPYEVCDNASPAVCAKATLYLLVPFNSTLPLNLLTFTAVKENDASAGLRWTTANEINTSHFVIERMLNGTGQWQAIGTVNTTGNGNTSVNHYYFRDVQPAAGANYYRLKQVDQDGRYKYSAVRLVSFAAAGNSSIYPNPAEEYAVISGSNLLTAQIHIYNALGQELSGMIKAEQISPQYIKLQLYKLPRGLYIIKVNGQALKLVKK